MKGQRVALVGRIHSLRQTATDLSFRLRSQDRMRGQIDYVCHSRAPHVLGAAQELADGQLVGVIVALPSRHAIKAGLLVEKLELLGRQAREVIC